MVLGVHQIFGDGFVRCHVYIMDLCLLIDKFGLFGLGKAAIYVSPSIEMDAWGKVGSHRPCGSPTLPEAFFAWGLLFISRVVGPSYIWKPVQGMSTIHSVKSSP